MKSWRTFITSVVRVTVFGHHHLHTAIIVVIIIIINSIITVITTIVIVIVIIIIITTASVIVVVVIVIIIIISVIINTPTFTITNNFYTLPGYSNLSSCLRQKARLCLSFLPSSSPNSIMAGCCPLVFVTEILVWFACQNSFSPKNSSDGPLQRKWKINEIH